MLCVVLRVTHLVMAVGCEAKRRCINYLGGTSPFGCVGGFICRHKALAVGCPLTRVATLLALHGEV